MASLNLSSLSTLWGSIKTFINSHFLNRWISIAGGGHGYTEVTISGGGTVFEYKKIAVMIGTNDSRCFSVVIDVDPLNKQFVPVISVSAYTSSNVTYPFIKATMLSISADGTKISITNTTEISFQASSVNTYNQNSMYIQEVFGIY